MALSDTAKLVAELTLDDKLSKGVQTAMGSIGKLEKGMSRVGRGAGQVSAGMTRAGTIIGAAAVGGVAAATKAFIDWEDAFAGVVKTVDQADLAAAGLTFEDLSKGLRDMSSEMPNTALDLAGIAEAAGALGIKAKDILAFTKQVAILASTTDVSADDAATALGQLQNVIGLTGDEFDNFAASLVQLGNTGASTESTILEITRRAGGAAKAIHLSKDATLAFASATANLGLEAEAGGTNLGKFFDKAQVAFLKGSKTLQELLGESGKDLRKAFTEDPQKALRDMLGEIGKLKGAEQLDVITSLFGNNAVTRRLVRDLAGSLDKNLDPALKEAAQSWKDATAAQAEFDKRNATVKSSLSRLRNNLLNLAVTLGEGVAPAIARTAEKLSTFLKDPANAGQVKALGEDIGKALDSVDWQQVLAGAKTFVGFMKTAFDYAKHIFDLVNALPTEIKAAGAGFLALNKLSGGLIGSGVGNIVGGLAQTIIRGVGAQLPGVGRAFAQPVFVTNWPAGGLGGPGLTGAAGAAALPSIMSLIPIAGIVAAATGAVNAEANRQAHAVGLKTEVANPFAGGILGGLTSLPSMLDVMRELLGVAKDPPVTPIKNVGPKNITGGPDDRHPFTKPGPGTVGTGPGPQGRREFNRSQATLAKNVTDVRDKVEAAKIAGVSATDKVQRAATAVRDKVESAKVAQVSATRVGATSVVGATDRGSGNIVSAIHGIPAPIVNVNVTGSEVTKTTTEQKRHGGGGSSRNKDRATPA